MKHIDINKIRRAMALVAVMVVTMATVIAQTAVKYIDKNGEEQTCPTTCTVVGTGTTVWNAGWYLVNGEVEISGGVTVTGEVHLILGDGASLTVTGAAGKAGVNVSGAANSLTVYGQSGGTGQLIANGMGYANYDKAVGSGGTGGGAGIGGNDMQSGGNITVNGGIVTANGGGGGAGIGGGCDGSAYNIEINRGTVTANGSLLSTGIGVGRIQKKYLFSVSATKTVEFSQGNLYWDGTAEEGKKWKFEANQWDYRTWAGKNSCIGGTVTDNGTPSSNCGLFKWGDKDEAIDDTDSNPSGEFFAASNFTVEGGTGWKTLTNDEWGYLLSTRKVTVGGEHKASYGEGKVNGVNGLIILPDSWDGSLCKGFTYGESEWSNTFSEETSTKWSVMEAAGAVFLPAAGYRGSDVDDVGSFGFYWSSTPKETIYAYRSYFYLGNVITEHGYRRLGYAIRLVREQKIPNTTATLTLSIGENTAAKELNAEWKNGDVVNVYNVNEQVGELSYRNHDGGKATFTGYINENLTAGTLLTFRRDTTPAFTEQDGKLETLKTIYSLEGTANYNLGGTYTMNMGTPYALMKLDLSAFGTADGMTVTIRTGSPGEVVASVTGVTTTPKELYVAMPANGVETEYTFCGNGGVLKKTWTLEANKFYTKEGSTTGEAIEVSPVETNEWIDFNDPAMGVSGLPKWAKYNVGVDTTDLDAATDWYGNYYAWGATTTWYNTYGQTDTATWKTGYSDGYSFAHIPHTNGKYSTSNKKVFTKYIPQNQAGTFGNNGFYDNKTVLEATDDAATMVLGGSWRMPTGGGSGEWQQLKNNTYFQWTETYNDVTDLKGYIVYKVKSADDKGALETAPSGQSYTTADPHMFLPAAGYRTGTYRFNANTEGNYWSGSLYASNPERAFNMCIKSDGVFPLDNHLRSFGFSVRSVRNTPNSITITLDTVANTVAKALEAAWKEGDVVNVYKDEEQVGTLSYCYDEGRKPIFKGYINDTLAENTPLTFRYGTTPSFTRQDGTLATLKSNYSLEGTTSYNAAGTYRVTMGTPYAVMKLDLSAFGTTEGTTVTIKVETDTIATIAGVTASSNELYVAMPTAESRKYTISGNSHYGYKTWELDANTFYSKDGIGTGEAIVIEPDAVDFGLTGGLLWATCNLGATNDTTAASWYGDYYAWGATTTWYEAGHAQDEEQKHWKTNYPNGYSWKHCPYTQGTYSNSNKRVFTKYVPDGQAATYGYNGHSDTLTVLEATDDAAHAVLGGAWRMPTSAEWQALEDNNTLEWLAAGATSTRVTTFKAVAAGWLVIKGGKKGIGMDATVYMFLPAAGYRFDGSLSTGSKGHYWSSSLKSDSPRSAHYFEFGFRSHGMNSHHRSYGRSVRPVR